MAPGSPRETEQRSPQPPVRPPTPGLSLPSGYRSAPDSPSVWSPALPGPPPTRPSAPRVQHELDTYVYMCHPSYPGPVPSQYPKGQRHLWPARVRPDIVPRNEFEIFKLSFLEGDAHIEARARENEPKQHYITQQQQEQRQPHHPLQQVRDPRENNICLYSSENSAAAGYPRPPDFAAAAKLNSGVKRLSVKMQPIGSSSSSQVLPAPVGSPIYILLASSLRQCECECG